MLDSAIRIVLIVVVGVALSIAVIWYVGFLYQELRGTGQVVIDSATVVDEQGKTNDDTGKAFAQMLQARMQSLAYELADAQRGLTTKVQASAVAEVAQTGWVGDVRLWTQTVALQTALLQPIDMKVSVAGVDVGGLLPWLQKRLSNRRTLHFTLYLRPPEAQIFGSLAALSLPQAGLQLTVRGDNEKTPPLDKIVDQLAHEIIHRYLARDHSNKLDILDADEFTTLSMVLTKVAEGNRKSLAGRPAQKDFEVLVRPITDLADKVPTWPELGYLAAKIADSGKDSATAITYYKRVQPIFEKNAQTDVVQVISKRVVELTSISRAQVTAEVASITLPTTAIPTALDYSSGNNLIHIRDSGPEGSVVGMAFATAMEYLLNKGTDEQRVVSARYIYYAARKRTKSEESDSGASLENAIAALSTEGTVAESVWPYKPGDFAKPPPPAVNDAPRFRITDPHRLATDVATIKQALQIGPVVAGITVFEQMTSPSVSKTGLISLPTKKESIVGGHAIVLVGYDDSKAQFKFANSWGKTWGDHGFGYLPYDYFSKYGSEAWTFKVVKPG